MGNMNRALATEYTQNPDTISKADVVWIYTVPVRQSLSHIKGNFCKNNYVIKAICDAVPVHI